MPWNGGLAVLELNPRQFMPMAEGLENHRPFVTTESLMRWIINVFLVTVCYLWVHGTFIG